MKRNIRLALVALTAFVLGAFLQPHLYTYNGLNAGIVLDLANGYPQGITVGLEYRGSPSLFICGQVDC